MKPALILFCIGLSHVVVIFVPWPKSCGKMHTVLFSAEVPRKMRHRVLWESLFRFTVVQISRGSDGSGKCRAEHKNRNRLIHE